MSKCEWCHDMGGLPRCEECGRVREHRISLPIDTRPPCDDPFRVHPYMYWVVLDENKRPLLDCDSDAGNAECGYESRLFVFREPGEAASMVIHGPQNDLQGPAHSIDSFNLCHDIKLEKLIEAFAFVVHSYKAGQRGAMLGIEHAEETLTEFMKAGRLK